MEAVTGFDLNGRMPHPTQASPPGSWRYGALAALVMLLVALAPHLYFIYKRGPAWNGTLPLTHGDEAIYASYVAARVDGRPRRADPYTGRDDAPEDPRPESFMSIQFLPPSVLAAAARTFGASAQQAFFALSLLSALATTLALYWTMKGVVGDARAAAVGAFAVLCLGSAQLVVEYLLGTDNPANYLSFLRRHPQAFTFPFFFLFCGLVWRTLETEGGRARRARAFGAGACFAALVFSYFFLWTAALAWLFCLSAVWLLRARGREGREGLKSLGVVWALAAAALAPYFYLLSNRAPVTDAAQLMVGTHAPDLARLPLLFGLVVLAALVWAVRAGRVARDDRAALFVASLALTPFVVFNQQVLTGRSVQPSHYAMFGANYLTLAAALLTAALAWRGRAGRRVPVSALAVLALVALAAGSYQALLSGRRHWSGNMLRDEARPAMLRLSGAGRRGAALDTRSLVFCTDPTVADTLPTVAPQPLLWAASMYYLSGVSTEEDRERMSLYLHLAGIRLDDVDPQRFEELDRFKKYFVSSLINRTRQNPRLRVDWTPITPDEIELALRRYTEFVTTLDRARVERYPLAYVLTSPDERLDFTNLDRWYERDAGERAGSFVIYRVRLRPPG